MLTLIDLIKKKKKKLYLGREVCFLLLFRTEKLWQVGDRSKECMHVWNLLLSSHFLGLLN